MALFHAPKPAVECFQQMRGAAPPPCVPVPQIPPPYPPYPLYRPVPVFQTVPCYVPMAGVYKQPPVEPPPFVPETKPAARPVMSSIESLLNGEGARPKAEELKTPKTRSPFDMNALMNDDRPAPARRSPVTHAVVHRKVV